MIKEKASGAGRCRHPPHARSREGALPTPSEPLGLLHEKAAGHSCRRRAKPDLHIATGAAAIAIGSLGPGASPGEGPVNSRPTSGRNTNPARRRSTGIAEAFHDAWRGASAMPRPPWTGRQVFHENDLAFHLDDRSERGRAVPA